MRGHFSLVQLCEMATTEKIKICNECIEKNKCFHSVAYKCTKCLLRMLRPGVPIPETDQTVCMHCLKMEHLKDAWSSCPGWEQPCPTWLQFADMKHDDPAMLPHMKRTIEKAVRKHVTHSVDAVFTSKAYYTYDGDVKQNVWVASRYYELLDWCHNCHKHDTESYYKIPGFEYCNCSDPDITRMSNIPF